MSKCIYIYTHLNITAYDWQGLFTHLLTVSNYIFDIARIVGLPYCVWFNQFHYFDDFRTLNAFKDILQAQIHIRLFQYSPVLISGFMANHMLKTNLLYYRCNLSMWFSLSSQIQIRLSHHSQVHAHLPCMDRTANQRSRRGQGYCRPSGTTWRQLPQHLRMRHQASRKYFD